MTHRWRHFTLAALISTLIVTVGIASGAVQASHQHGMIADGTPWETPYYSVDSGKPGPTVLITGGVHGDEPAGAAAAEQVRHWPILRGKLIVVPRCNAPGLRAKTRRMPDTPKELSDPNRNFPKTDAPDEARTVLCKALWAFAARHKPDWHIDLHEGTGFRAAGSKSCGSSVIAYPNDETHRLRTRMLDAINATISDPKKKLVPLGPSVNGSLARACAERLGAHAIILETTTHDIESTPKKPVYQFRALRTRQQRIMLHRLLSDLQMIDCAAVTMLPPRVAGGPVRVAVYNGGGTGNTTSAYFGSLIAGGKAVTRLAGPDDIRDGALKQFDVVVFPGGSGSRQAAAIGEKGREAVREFVNSGGGYLGVCAGAYLATMRYGWSLKILDACTVDSKHWARGTGMIKMEMTPAGRELLGGRDGLMAIYYGQGPLLGVAEAADVPDYTVLAWYRSEIAKNGAPEGVMVNTPAIISGTFGKGRVIAVSPHPEKAKSEAGSQKIILRAVQWLGKRNRAGAAVPSAGSWTPAAHQWEFPKQQPRRPSDHRVHLAAGGSAQRRAVPLSQREDQAAVTGTGDFSSRAIPKPMR